MPPHELGDRVRPVPPRIELGVPGRADDVAQECLHPDLVILEETAIQVARVPVDEHATEVEDDGVDRAAPKPVTHRPILASAAARVGR
jgi:hypothetical protein